MGKFNYGWYTVDVVTTCGVETYEIKAKTEAGARKQIEKMVNDNHKKHEANAPWWESGAYIKEVLWETMKLDRVGYQRLY